MRDCLLDAVGQSSCSPTNVTCICNDTRLNNMATACITSSCTVKESLTAKNLTSQLCGLPDHGDDSLIPIYSVFIGLAVVAVALRLVARVVTHAYFWWDDLACFIGFLCAAGFTGVNIKAIQLGQSKDIWFVPFDNITLVVELFYYEMLLYTITRFFVRASIILFYMRVFPPTKRDGKINLGRLVQATFVFNVVYNVSFLLAVVFQCYPIADFWRQWEGPLVEGHCGNANVLAWVAAATGIVFDLWLLALPFSQLWTLNLHWKRKVMGGLMFFVGVAVMIISLVRLKTINQFTRAVNPTKDIVQVCLWSGIELDVGVICPCLPSFRLLLRRLLPRAMGTTGRYEMDPMSNANSGMRSGLRRSLGGAPGGRIVVENTVDVKYGGSDDSNDSASVSGLVRGRASSAKDEESGPGNGHDNSGRGRAR
ncbi:uncharacterized protein THITE_2116393 [Thermothielavioides terrestris NRRL 8126]|uniref:Uncharacterized protein n=1 Tax=Thermothielavioides terrestris (strain ATCC 38088 / NRRL 8126) TaxID=578455 RepID=G2R5R9_THETT|nr:uncharacterized protein THITE_2116393 [Thermothielavioides terrestris NRRL 8126]AEO67508.1 hypothetical protein THITE_2116393 [Thermothielavioides terrestris NRRL 8126]